MTRGAVDDGSMPDPPQEGSARNRPLRIKNLESRIRAAILNSELTLLDSNC